MVGHGLGCYVDGETEDTWAVTAESAEQRICYLMNQSATELDVFQINQDGADAWPESFWIPQLEKFLAGGGCDAEIPARTACPNATVGPADSWSVGGDAPGCCVSSSSRVGAYCDQACAEAECAAAPGMAWKPENYSTHPYECCKTR